MNLKKRTIFILVGIILGVGIHFWFQPLEWLRVLTNPEYYQEVIIKFEDTPEMVIKEGNNY